MRRELALLVVAFGPMLLEARRSRRNERRLLEAGAVEPAGDVFRTMQVVYPACFLTMVAEGRARGGARGRLAIPGAALFVTAKALKYWAVATLGSRWTFRVLIPPDAIRVTRGPYRLLRHPNYAGVAGELAGMAAMARAPVAGVVSLVVFGGLMLARIRVEERAMGRRGR